MIILTEDEALKVAGVSAGNVSLVPFPLLDGTFVLPEEVLTDPAHVSKHAFLATLPTREVAKEEYLYSKLEEIISLTEAGQPVPIEKQLTAKEQETLSKWSSDKVMKLDPGAVDEIEPS